MRPGWGCVVWAGAGRCFGPAHPWAGFGPGQPAQARDRCAGLRPKTGVEGTACLPSPLPSSLSPLPAAASLQEELGGDCRWSPDEEAVGGQAPFRPEAGLAWGPGAGKRLAGRLALPLPGLLVIRGAGRLLLPAPTSRVNLKLPRGCLWS